MAEFALGLTKTAVEGTVSRVKAAIDEEENLKVRVQNDLVFITGEFQMMQSFLNVANKERAKNEVVRTWVRQIRDLAFDVEDCVELVVSLDVKSGWSWLWRVLPGCMAPPQPIDEAVAKIQRLKARVEDVSQRNARYNLISDSGSSSFHNSKHALVTIASSSPASSEPIDTCASSSPFDILRKVWEAAGKLRGDMGDLKKLITNQGSDIEVISLWGSAADLGKTHIIREAYNDPQVCQEFKGRAWVKVMHPFNPDEFLKSLLAQFYSRSHRAKLLDGKFKREMRAAVAEEDDLTKAQLMKQVSDEQRYLVIVEGLSTMAEWDTIRMYLPDSKNGSRIIVTTLELGLALSCTGNPYQVSEIRQFSYGQSLCAFFSKVSGRRSDMGELIWQLSCGGVISVWRCNPDEPTLLYEVYTGITQKSKVFEGIEFERQNWVDVPDPFDLGIFSRHLFFNFHSDDLRAKEILTAGIMGDTGVIQGCRKFLQEDHCLVVINGLKSTDDWNLIKSAFLSEPTKCCILVTTTEESVAKYCVDKENRALDLDELDADMVLRHSLKSCENYGSEDREVSSRGHFFSDRKQEARDWINKFRLVTDPTEENPRKLHVFLKHLGVISLCGTIGAWKSSLARQAYYEQMLIASEDDIIPKCNTNGIEIDNSGFTKYSWVDVPHPFNLMDFCWRLFLDFHSDDLEAKQTVAFSMLEGRQDPIEGCLKFLRKYKCFVVIDDLQSRDDWDLIKDVLLCQPTEGCILVTTDKKSVATHCVDHEDRVFFTDGHDDNVAGHPLLKEKGYSNKDMSRIFSSRMIEARRWMKFQLIGRGSDWLDIYRNTWWDVSSVWGIAGVGKSAIVRRIYSEDMLGTYLDQTTTYYSWVDVPHTFNLIDLSRHLLMDFHSVDFEAKEIAAVGMIDGQDPIQLCRNILQESSCLVVIDGLRSTHDWDLIKASFLSGPVKGRIIVITNNESVAKHCVNNKDNVVNIKGLEAHEALKLYTKIAWNGKQLDYDYVEPSRHIMTKCGGLPKVIVAIGEYHLTSLHRHKLNNEAKKWSMESTNVDFMSLLETNPTFHNLRSLFAWMQSYFDDCHDSLKPCIFYLSIFPLGHNIRQRRLLRRWIAEGYCRDTAGSIAEENGKNFFSELIKLCIIQKQEEEEDVWQVNGFFREYIISRPMQDNLVFALEGRCILNSQRVGQHLTITSSWDRDKILFESMEFSRLRSLTIFGEWRPFFISAGVDMKLLRVLDLEDTTGVTNCDIEQVGKLFPHLKFLSLRGCKYITCLPCSLGGMRQLQTLDIKGTFIATLPLAILKLEKLQYVRAGITHGILASTANNDRTMPGATRPQRQPQQSDRASTSQPSPPEAGTTTSITTPMHRNGSSPSQPSPPAVEDDDGGRESRPLPLDLVFSRLSKLRKHGLVSSARDGVQFPHAAIGGIGKFTALHTLGFINVGVAGGNAILRELKKLTQLCKLRLSGINKQNWHDFCCTISGHGYLVSLSVLLVDDEPHDLWCISDPPKTLQSLKLHGGNIRVSPAWIKQLDNLTKVQLVLTLSTQDDIESYKRLPNTNMYRHICIKTIQDGELSYGLSEYGITYSVLSGSKFLKIDCGSYRLRLDFGWLFPQYFVVMAVHCSSPEAFLHISGINELYRLEEVWLKGSYSEAVKQHLQQIVDEHSNKPVLKLFGQQFPPAPPSAE